MKPKLRESLYWTICIIICTFFVVGALWYRSSLVPDKVNTQAVTKPKAKQVQDTITLEKFITELNKYKWHYPKQVLNQALNESNYFKSHIFKITNNMFCLKRQAYTTLNDTVVNGFLGYRSWRDNILDRWVYEILYMRNLTLNQYHHYCNNQYITGK